MLDWCDGTFLAVPPHDRMAEPPAVWDGGGYWVCDVTVPEFEWSGAAAVQAAGGGIVKGTRVLDHFEVGGNEDLSLAVGT